MNTNDSTIIVGSLVDAQRTRPFIFNRETGELDMGDFAPQASPPHLVPAEAEQLKRQILDAAGGIDAVVRLGEYHCYDCGRWLPATRKQWSVSICLSCSLDRGSELADYYFDR